MKAADRGALVRNDRRSIEEHGTIPAQLVSRGQLVRLLQLILILRGGRFPNARGLAEACEVSRRTVYRDLEALALAGVPVRYRADRQGYGLAPGFFFEAPRLEEDEAAAFLVLARRGASGEGCRLRSAARGAELKLLQALPEPLRARMQALAEALDDNDRPPARATDREAVIEAILRALADRRQVRIWAREGELAEIEATKLSPYRLILDGGDWCLIGRSSRDRAIRAIPVPRIERVEPTDEPAIIPPRFDPSRHLAELPASRRRATAEVRLRFAARVATEARAVRWHPAQRLEALEGGRVEVRWEAEPDGALVGRLLGLGDQVEVIAPESLRQAVRDAARRVARLYEPDDRGPRPEPPALSRPRAAGLGG